MHAPASKQSCYRNKTRLLLTSAHVFDCSMLYNMFSEQLHAAVCLFFFLYQSHLSQTISRVSRVRQAPSGSIETQTVAAGDGQSFEVRKPMMYE